MLVKGRFKPKQIIRRVQIVAKKKKNTLNCEKMGKKIEEMNSRNRSVPLEYP